MMKAQILTEIDVDPDGLHCGGKCKLRYVHCVTCRSVCLLDGKELSDANDRVHYIRNAACLAAQKAAEGMTWGVIGKDEPKDDTLYIVECGKDKKNIIRAVYLPANTPDMISVVPYPTKYKEAWWICEVGHGHNCKVKDGDRFYPVPVKEKE